MLSFFFRFGSGLPEECKKNNDNVSQEAFTTLDKNSVLVVDGSRVELSSVYKIEYCTKLFSMCFHRLIKSLQQQQQQRSVSPSFGNDDDYDKSIDNKGQRHGRSSRRISFLSSIIDVKWLRSVRDTCRQRAEQGQESRQEETSTYPHPYHSRHDQREISASSMHPRKRQKVHDKKMAQTVNIANTRTKYNSFNRSTRGSIMPKYRPDLEARETKASTKNRKNKKKQFRDKPWESKAFAHL